MLKVKLAALEHPSPDSVNIDDKKTFASTILWLEDQKIRHYKIEDRMALRNLNPLNKWDIAYQRYKKDLGMPKFTTGAEEIVWLTNIAVRLEYLDDIEKYKSINSDFVSQKSGKANAPSVKTENSFDNIDFNSKDFVNGVRNLACKLGIAYHPDHLVQLEAVKRIVHDRLSPAAAKNPIITGTPFPFENGNDVISEDPKLDYAGRILRLLQIQNLRNLQTNINETIVAVQDLTADPRTDTKLGKVGF